MVRYVNEMPIVRIVNEQRFNIFEQRLFLFDQRQVHLRGFVDIPSVIVHAPIRMSKRSSYSNNLPSIYVGPRLGIVRSYSTVLTAGNVQYHDDDLGA